MQEMREEGGGLKPGASSCVAGSLYRHHGHEKQLTLLHQIYVQENMRKEKRVGKLEGQ